MEQIVKIICYDKKVIIIDKERIKDRLDGAYSWLRFLEINKGGFMSDSKDSDGCLTFCDDYSIISDEMLILIKYLRTGILPKKKSDLENLYNISIILGGIPKLDKDYVEYTEYINKKKIELDGYNPMRPEQDNLNLYIWLAERPPFVLSSDGWSMTDKLGRNNSLYYFRKKKSEDNDLSISFTNSKCSSMKF